MVVRKFDFKILLKISLAHSRIPVTFLTPWSMLYLLNNAKKLSSSPEEHLLFHDTAD